MQPSIPKTGWRPRRRVRPISDGRRDLAEILDQALSHLEAGDRRQGDVAAVSDRSLSALEAALNRAEAGDELIGFACVYGGDDETWGSLLNNIHVRPRHQQQGAGEQPHVRPVSAHRPHGTLRERCPRSSGDRASVS